MRKLKILLLLICIIIALPTVYAGDAYVDSIDIDAKVNIDGSMNVTETIVWDIVEDLNGVYRDILIKNSSNSLNSASGIVIKDVVVEGKKFNYSYSTLQNGEDGKYNINDIAGGKQVKIFTPSEDEYKTTVITYTLYDVIVEYQDIAELYWNFIGDGWDYGIDNVNINITLPGIDENLKVYAHGPLNGASQITSENSVNLKVNRLRSGEQVDARILFDTSLVDATKVESENELAEILLEETELAIEANKRREEAKKIWQVSIVIFVVALVIPIVTYISARRKAIKAEFKGKYYRELPEDYGPAIMNKVLFATGYVSSYDMLATLLDLVRRKYVIVEPITKTGKKKPSDYNLKLINKNLEELNKSERHFVEKLIFVDTDEIALKELSKKNSKSMKAQSKAHEAFEKWTEIVKTVAKEKELLKTEKTKIGKDIFKCILGLLLMITILIIGIVNNYEDILGLGALGLIISIFEVVIVIVSLVDMNIRTKKGVEHKAMWKAFKKFLLDFSKLDERDFKSIAIWEHYLVYATALGISKKVIKELKIVYPTEFKEDSEMFNTYVTIRLLSDSSTFNAFESSFTSAASTAFSSPSSSSGSGGGFAGGAGGGRRWRRRWRLLVTKKNTYQQKVISHLRNNF